MLNNSEAAGWCALAILSIAGVIAMARWAFTILRIVRLRSRYRLSGHYISYYQKQIDGKLVTQKARVKIRQHGFLATGRAKDWRGVSGGFIRGQLAEPGLLSGSYFRNGRHDLSRGVFFLAADVKRPGTWEGAWSGFDPETKSVVAGKCQWHRCERVKVRTLNRLGQKWAKEALPLISNLLGSAYITQEKIDSYAERDDRILLVSTMSKALAGVAMVKILNDIEIADIQSKHGIQLEGRALASTAVGLIKCLVVHQDFQKQGVGRALAARALDQLHDRGCVVVYAVVRDAEGQDSSLNLFIDHGFSAVCKIPDYWKDESIRDRYHCSVCGAPPCQCTVTLLRKWL